MREGGREGEREREREKVENFTVDSLFKASFRPTLRKTEKIFSTKFFFLTFRRRRVVWTDRLVSLEWVTPASFEAADDQ